MFTNFVVMSALCTLPKVHTLDGLYNIKFMLSNLIFCLTFLEKFEKVTAL